MGTVDGAGPIRSVEELSRASVTRMRDQLAYEIARLLDLRGWTQEQLAHELGYESASPISRWVNGRGVVPAGRAAVLDRLIASTSIGVSFVELRAQYERNRRRYPEDRRLVRRSSGARDVFLASPMASASGRDSYAMERERAGDLARIIESYCGYSVYYAGDEIESDADFEAPGIALAVNVEALRDSRHFVLLLTEPLVKPSSVWVEAGLALAYRKPLTLFVDAPQSLPYMLRQVADARDVPGVPAAQVFYDADVRMAGNLVKKHRGELFDRLLSGC